jgi:hypothetical protein
VFKLCCAIASLDRAIYLVTELVHFQGSGHETHKACGSSLLHLPLQSRGSRETQLPSTQQPGRSWKAPLDRASCNGPMAAIILARVARSEISVASNCITATYTCSASRSVATGTSTVTAHRPEAYAAT